MEEFPVSRGALAQQLGTVAPIAAIGGIAGAAAGEEAGVNPLLAGLAGTVLGGAGGSAAARFARLAPMSARRGSVTGDILTGGLTGAGAAATRFKAAAENAKFAGVQGREAIGEVADATLASILGGKRLIAPTPQEIASLPETASFLQGLTTYTKPRLTAKELRMTNPEARAALEAEGLPLDIRSMTLGQRGVGSIPTELPAGSYEMGSAFKQVGMKPISVGGNTWDMTKVSPQNVLLFYAQKGDLDGFAEAYSKMLNNQLSLYPEAAVKAIKEKSGAEFYPVARDFILSVSEATKLPPHVVGIGLAAASAKATPVEEVKRVVEAIKLLKMEDGKVIVDDVTPWGGMFTKRAAQAMAEVINNPSYAHTNIPGIANKTWLYNLSKFDPENFGIYTNDSIDTFVLAGTTNTPITISDFAQSLAGRSVGLGATQANEIAGPLGQALPWFSMRALRPDVSQIGGSFNPGLVGMVESGVKGLSGLDEVAEFAKFQVDDLLKSGQLGSSYRMTDQGILVPNTAEQAGLLVPYEARNVGSEALEGSMRSFTEAIGGATRAAGTRGGKVKAARKAPAPSTGPVLGMSLDDALGKAPAAKKAAAPKKGTDLEKTRSKMERYEEEIAIPLRGAEDGVSQESFINYIAMLKDNKNPLHDAFMYTRGLYQRGNAPTADEEIIAAREIAFSMRRARRFGLPREFAEETADRDLDLFSIIDEKSYVNDVDFVRGVTSEFFDVAPPNIVKGLQSDDTTSLKTFESFIDKFDTRIDFDPVTKTYLDESTLNNLSPSAKETFWSLLPEWDGSMLDLLEVAKSLSA
jgi:hypothetical protein